MQKSSLVKKLDRLFSKYIRYSQSPNGYCVCYTCKHIAPPQDMDAGHYITRNHMATRWDERNVKPQCRKCNRFESGVSDEFALHLVKDHGVEVLEELNRAKWIPTQIGDLEIMGLIEVYKEKLENLETDAMM